MIRRHYMNTTKNISGYMNEATCLWKIKDFETLHLVNVM